MKALSVYPFWAAAIVQGSKDVEIRKWSTRYRGPILICATKRPNPHKLPAGVTICTAELVDCRPMHPDDARRSGVKFNPKTFAWVLRDVRPVENVPIIGRQKLFRA